MQSEPDMYRDYILKMQLSSAAVSTRMCTFDKMLLSLLNKCGY